MDKFRLVYKPSVEKDLRRVPWQIATRLLVVAEALRTEPHPPGTVKLAGAERLYRARVGVYRIIYEVNADEKCVTVHYIRHRRDAYRAL